MIESKIFKPSISKSKRKGSTNIFKISILNKSIEIINVLHISDDPSIKASLPTDIKFDHPTVAY